MLDDHKPFKAAFSRAFISVLSTLACGSCVWLPGGSPKSDFAGGPEAPMGPLVLSKDPGISRELAPAHSTRSRGVAEPGSPRGGASRAADLTDVELDLVLDVEAGRLSGRAKSTFEGLRAETRTLYLHALDLEILEILDSAGKALSHRKRPGSMVEVTLEQPLAAGDIATIDVRFSARPVRGFASSLVSDGSGALMEGDFAPEVYGTGDPYGLSPWLPIFDGPGELARFHLTMRVRDKLSVVSCGSLIEISEPDGVHGDEQIYRWTSQAPIPTRSFALAVASFETFAAKGGETELYFHVPKGTDAETAQRTFGESAAVLAFFGSRLDAQFPFPRYDQAVLERLDGRMRNGASLTLLDSDELVTAEAALDDRRERPRRAVARGIARAWFGAWIAPLEEHHRWLLDGLSYLLELDYEAHVRGGFEVDLEWEFVRTKIVRRSRELIDHGAPSELDEEEVRERRAERAGFVMRMVQHRLGEDSFWPLLRAFGSGENGRVVTTEDLRRLCINREGTDLGPMIAQWSGRTDVPELEVRFQRREVVGVGDSIGVVVTQTQPGPLYAFELPVVVHYEDGSSEERVMHVAGERSLLIQTPELRIVDISIDPKGTLLAGFDIVKEPESWISQGGLTRTPIERMRALPALERLAKRDEDARQTLIMILLKSPEPTLRETCTASMRFPGPTCTLALMSSAAEDASPWVRRAAAHALINSFADDRWEPTSDEVETLRQIRAREQSPAAQDELDELLQLVSD